MITCKKSWVGRSKKTVDARNRTFYRDWIIDVLAQYAISCVGNETGHPDYASEPASLAPPNAAAATAHVLSGDVDELKAAILMDVPAAVWTGVENLHLFRGLFLDRLTSARQKQAAALKARFTATVLQAEFGAQSEDKESWCSTDRPGQLAAAAAQEIVAFGPKDPETQAYPKAWIAHLRPDGGPLQFSRLAASPTSSGSKGELAGSDGC